MIRLRRFAASARQARRRRAWLAALTLVVPATLSAHSGPPFPIVTDVVYAPYTISIWTDPDATDDGSPGGQFWVVLALTPKEARIPPDTRVTVSARRITGAPDANGNQSSSRRPVTAVAAPIRGDLGNQFAALVLSHEGLYDVRVVIDGPFGRAAVDSRIEATYDTRPPAYMLVWYLVPFLLAGFLWTQLLLRRRRLFRKG